jgi:transcriptional regulator with XRE-family HTH domain
MPKQFEKSLLEAIEAQLPENLSLAKELESRLGVTRSAVYKKIRGEASFSVAEMLQLARSFGISLDRLAFEAGGNQLFQYSNGNPEPQSPEEYLGRIQVQLMELLSEGNPQMWHITNDLPFFWYFFFPEICSFKLLIWSYISRGVQGDAQDFEPQHFAEQYPQLDAIRSEIAKLYIQVPTTEIWPAQFAEHMLIQIHKTLEAHVISVDAARILLDKMQELLNLIALVANTGIKQTPDGAQGASVQLYLNELILSGEMIFIENESGTTVHLPLDIPNFLSSSQTGFNVHVRQYMDAVVNASTRISKDGELQRQRVLNMARKRLQFFREEMRLT